MSTQFQNANKIKFMPLPYIGMFDLDVIYQSSDAELLYQVLYKINEIAKSQNIIVDNFEKVVDWATNQLETFSTEQLNKWLNNGTFENMINDNLLAEINNKVDNFTESVSTNSENIANLTKTINDINVKVNKYGVIQPSGTYANLSALQSALPQGNDNIYITLDNGNWNYWNGESWVSGGVFISGVNVQDINRYDVNFLNDYYINYKSGLVEGHYYDSQYVLKEDSNIDSTTFINVNSYKFIKLYTKNGVNIPNASIICFKNSANQFIYSILAYPSQIENGSYYEITTSIPAKPFVIPIPTEAVSFTIALMHDNIDNYLIILSNNANMLSPANIAFNENNAKNMTPYLNNFMLPLIEYHNLVDYNNPYLNGAYVANNGSEYKRIDICVSNKINMTNKRLLVIINNVFYPTQNQTYNVSYYDVNNTFIRNVGLSDANTYHTLQPPANAVYCCISYYYGYNNVIILDMNDLKYSPLISQFSTYDVNVHVIGDSIMYGYQKQTPVGKMVTSLRNYNYTNTSVSGACLSNNARPGYTSIYQQYQSISNQPDILILNGGVNDYQFHAQIGTIGGKDINTTIGALETIFSDAKSKGIKIIYIFSHKILNWWNTNNAQGYNFETLHDTIEQLCLNYSVPFIDVSQVLSSETTVYKNEFYNQDGIHPTTKLNRIYYLPLLLSQI